MNVTDTVFGALNNATESGYDMFKATEEQQVTDLMTYCSGLEDADPDEVQAAVQLWRQPL